MEILNPITGKLVTIDVPRPMDKTRQEQTWRLHKVSRSQRAARHYRIRWTVTSG
ncbi:hypothetical protein JOE48_001222 [Methylobacterium sp. PvR107]|nr:hypothetical protein [Methylobacterium sp. PvR107]